MKKNRKQYEDDDGRVIASMNVDGMPWYVPDVKISGPEAKNEPGNRDKLTGADRWAFTWGVLKAVLLVAVVFVVGYLLFILFCTNVWFAH